MIFVLLHNYHARKEDGKLGSAFKFSFSRINVYRNKRTKIETKPKIFKMVENKTKVKCNMSEC